MPDHVEDGRETSSVDAAQSLDQPSSTPPSARPGGRTRFARLAGLIAIAVLAGLIHPRALAAVAVVALVLVIGLFVPWFGVRGVRGHWGYPVRRGQVGRPLAVQVTVRSLSPWPVFGLLVRGGWTDPNGPDEDPVAVAIPWVPPFGVREFVVTAVPARRGVFPSHPPTIASGFPFGFREARRAADVSGQVVVWPEIVTLSAGGRDAGGVEGGVFVRAPQTVDQGEFVGTRPYRVGEPLHRIHWKQSARHDRLIAVEGRATSRRAVVLVIETDAAIHTRRPSGASLERALSVGASLAAGLAETGVHITLTFEAGRVFSSLNRPQLAASLDAMARFNGNGAGQDELLEQLPARSTRGVMTWIITTVAGRQRAGSSERSGHRKYVVVDERSERIVKATPRPPGLPRGVPLIPVNDPGHHGLYNAWKEVAGGFHGLV